MKRKIIKWLFCGLIVGVIAFAVGVYYCGYGFGMMMATAEVSDSLRDMHNALAKYYETNREWPRSLEEVKKHIDPNYFRESDPISQQPLLYYPDAKKGTKDVLLAQPMPFRTERWPFGEIRRYVLLANGDVRILIRQDAADDPRNHGFSQNEFE